MNNMCVAPRYIYKVTIINRVERINRNATIESPIYYSFALYYITLSVISFSGPFNCCIMQTRDGMDNPD